MTIPHCGYDQLIAARFHFSFSSKASKPEKAPCKKTTRVHICPIHRAGQRLKQGRASLDKSRPPFPDPTEDHTKE